MRRVLAIRRNEEEILKDSMIKFILPSLNYKALDYIDMINWSACQKTEPPLLKSISSEDLEIYVLMVHYTYIYYVF